MDEIEYIFNHALAKEAVYESILFHMRKELHLKVAGSIEKVFSDRLHEFYGMLAYHYSKGENFKKTEEYLIKSGEEALKSSASNEALHYYQEALLLYLEKHGDETDPGKIAMMEKNIALALYNRGLHDESIEHFDKALDHYWGKLPKYAVSSILKLLSASLHLLITLYLTSLKFRKIPTQGDIEVIDLFHKKCKALGTINPKRFFFEFMYMYKRVTSFNLKNFELGIEIYMDASALFSFSGFLFRLSRRILDSAKPMINKDNAKILINYDFLETILNYLQGNWKEINEYDDDLVNRNLSIGEIYLTSQHLFWHGLPYVYQGSLDKARFVINRLNEIIEVYENDFSILLKLELNIALLIECRKYHDALQEIERAIEITKKANFHMYLLDIYCYKIWIYSLMGEMEEADKNLTKANQIKNQVSTVPIILSTFYRSELELYMNRFKAAIRTDNRSSMQEYRKKVKKTGKLLTSVSQRAALYRTESYKLMGVYYWLINKQKKALKYWQKSIEAGEQLGARLELSRAYFEIGKRLLEPGSKYRELNGIKADEYLKNAKVLFEEMALEWDLNELNNVIKG